MNGEYARAGELNDIFSEILSTDELEHPLAKEYLDIVLAAASEGFEVVDLDVQGDQANVRVTPEPPHLVDLELQTVNGAGEIQP